MTGTPVSSTQEPPSTPAGTSGPSGEGVTASPLPQDGNVPTSVTKQPTEEAQDQTRGDELPQNPVTQEASTPTENPIVQGQDQSNDDAQTEATRLPGDAQTDVDDDATTSRPQDADDQATTTTQPTVQGPDEALPETTPSVTDALTNGDDVTSTPLYQDLEDQTTTATIKPTDQGLDETLDDAPTEATPDSQTGSEDVTKPPTVELQGVTTTENIPEVSTANPMNVTPDTKVTLQPQDKPVPSTVLPVNPDQNVPGTKPEVQPLSPSGNIDDTAGFQGGKNITVMHKKTQ